MQPLGLYIHVPFCAKKCPYCDFNTYAGLEPQFQATVDALCQEIANWGPRLASRSITTIFVGGGTPTVLNGAQLTQIFTTIRRWFALVEGCEITCEANPGTADQQKFAILRDLGVNRLSMGVQSFQPDELQLLGRIHSVEDVDHAYVAARTVGFDNINLDFMFGLPNQPLGTQPLEKWQATLERALQLGPEHLSLYSLIIEPNTPFHHWVATGKIGAPDEDQAADQYEFALARLADAGYQHYEVSNWAGSKPGERQISGGEFYSCAHNLIYWRNQEYLGIGPGAHSHLRLTGANGKPYGKRWSNRRSVPGYVGRIQHQEAVEDFSEIVDMPLAMGETMMLGLRLVNEGVPFARFYDLYGVDLRIVFADELQELQRLQLVALDQERVTLTQRGLLLGNQVFARFLPDTIH